MKFLLAILLSIGVTSLYSQDAIEGVWQAIDDKDNQPSSHIQLEVVDGVLTGTIIKLFDVADNIVCELCQGDNKDQPVKGMSILYNMKKKGESWSGGRVLDPEDGKDYKCKIYLEDDDTLKLRGYIGIPALGRTQTWYRVK